MNVVEMSNNPNNLSKMKSLLQKIDTYDNMTDECDKIVCYLYDT